MFNFVLLLYVLCSLNHGTKIHKTIIKIVLLNVKKMLTNFLKIPTNQQVSYCVKTNCNDSKFLDKKVG